MKLTEHYFDEATIAKDQTLKSEIDKPAFPITFNLDSFTATHNLLGEKKELPVASMSLPGVQPADAQPPAGGRPGVRARSGRRAS